MKKYVVERNLPGAGNLSPEELQAISKSSCELRENLEKPNYWVQSFVTEDKIYCIYIAESEAIIRNHSKLMKLPVNTIAEVKFIIDPLTSNPL